MSALQATELFRQTQVQIAAAHNALPVVEYLASCPEVDMGVRSLSGQTTLHLAAMMGHIDIIRFLLQVPFSGVANRPCREGADDNAMLHRTAYATRAGHDCADIGRRCRSCRVLRKSMQTTAKSAHCCGSQITVAGLGCTTPRRR
jgi:hypothetical protein